MVIHGDAAENERTGSIILEKKSSIRRRRYHWKGERRKEAEGREGKEREGKEKRIGLDSSRSARNVVRNRILRS